MNRGELSGDDAISLIFRELDYQRKVKGSNEFIYDFTNKIARRHLDRDDQEQILRTLNRQGMIELRIESASNDLESITGDDLHIIDLYLVDVTNTSWPTDISAGSDSEQQVARLILEENHLKVEFDNRKIITIRHFHDTLKPSDPHKLLIELFNKQIGYILRINDIFPNYKSLSKVLKDAKLGYLLPVFFANRSTKELQLLEMPVKINEADYKLLLSKSKEKEGKS